MIRCHDLPRRRVKSTTMAKAADMREAGMSYDEIAAALGISRGTAKNYVNNATRGDGRNHVGSEPRCAFCGLCLPCTCTGPMRATAFLGRSGDVSAVTVGLRCGGQ